MATVPRGSRTRTGDGTMIVNCAPPSGSVLAPNPPAFGRQQPAGDREPQTCSGRMPCLRAAIKRLEEVIQVGWVEPWTVIPDDEMRPIALCPCAYRRSAAPFGEYRPAFSSTWASAVDVKRGSTWISVRHPRRSEARVQRSPARRVRPQRRQCLRVRPTAGRDSLLPRRSAPCRGCPGRVVSADPVLASASCACARRSSGAK